jgi:hypothetical protein
MNVFRWIDPVGRIKAAMVMVMVMQATIVPAMSSAWASLSTLNSSMLATYYTPDQLCLISNSSGTNTREEHVILKDCRKELKYSNGLEFGFSATRPYLDEGTCCNSEKQLGYRDFDKVYSGMEEANPYPLKDLFENLSDKNQSILFLGDSLAATSTFAMIGEIERMIELGGIDAVLQGQKVTNINRYDLFWKYAPPPRSDGRLRNPVYLYYIYLEDFKFVDDLGEVKTLAACADLDRLGKLSRVMSDHPDGLVMLGNIGAHLKIDRARPDPLRRILNQKISQFILWLNDVTIMNPKHKVFWRESFPSHFGSVDGSHETWKGSQAEQNAYLNGLADRLHYHCKPLQNTSTEMMHSQVPENGIAKRVLENWTESRVRLFPVWSYFAPFWNMHCGTCHLLSKNIDCLHLCAYAPPMWTPIWVQLVEMVSSYPELTPDEEIEWKKQKLSFGRTSYERTKDSRVIESDGMYYLVEFGVKRLIVDGRPAVNILLQRTVKDSEIASVSAEELSRFPDVFEVKPFLQDDIVLKEINSTRYFVMKNMSRREMRDHDAVQVFMEKRSIPAWEIRNIPKDVLGLIPLGEPAEDE